MIHPRTTPRPKALWTRVPGAVPVAATKRQPKPTKARKPVRQASKKRASEQTLYRSEARAFVKEAIARCETCPVVDLILSLKCSSKYGHVVSNKLNEVHHRFGRVGRLLRWKPGWMAISKQGHRFVNMNPAVAMSHGWIGPAGTWNDYERARVFIESQQPKKPTGD